MALVAGKKRRHGTSIKLIDFFFSKMEVENGLYLQYS